LTSLTIGDDFLDTSKVKGKSHGAKKCGVSFKGAYATKKIVNEPTYSKKTQKQKKKSPFAEIFKITAKNSRVRIRKPMHGSKDPDPYQNFSDPEQQ
jgi:hypothetical protein